MVNSGGGGRTGGDEVGEEVEVGFEGVAENEGMDLEERRKSGGVPPLLLLLL